MSNDDTLLLMKLRLYCATQAKLLPNGSYLGSPIDETTNRVFPTMEEAIRDWMQYMREATTARCVYCGEPATGRFVVGEHTFPICQRCAEKRMIDALKRLDKSLDRLGITLDLLKAMIERNKCEAEEEIDWIGKQAFIISGLVLAALAYLVWELF